MRGRILGVLRALDDHAARRPVLAGLAIAAAVAIAAVAWFGSAALGGRFLLDTSLGQDIYHLSALYERHAHYALGGRFPFWLPEFQGGVAAPATWMYGLLYPPVLLFGLIPAQLAWSWLAVLHLALAAGGMFALVFDERRDVTGAATAAALFALSELMVGRVLCGHLNLVLAIAWIPWVLWLVGRAVAGRPGAVAWLGLVTGVGLVSGHVQIWFYAGPLVGLHAVN